MTYFASTPVSPPNEFIWVLFLYSAAFVAMNGYLLIRHIHIPEAQAFGRAIAAGLAFILSFLFAGNIVYAMTTAPLPSVGISGHAQFALGWRHMWHLFIAANTAGLLFMTVSLLCVGVGRKRLRELGKMALLKLIAFNIALYLACLFPYAVTNGLTHGWAGSYSSCGKRLIRMKEALGSYARDHNDRLPEARNMDELREKLDPYVGFHSDIYFVCSEYGLRERHPRQFVWNTRFSGARLSEVEKLEKPEPLIVCPYFSGDRYHKEPWAVSTTGALYAAGREKAPEEDKAHMREKVAELLEAQPAGCAW